MRKLFLGVFIAILPLSTIQVSIAADPSLNSSAGAQAGATASSTPIQNLSVTNTPVSGLGQAEADASNSFAVDFHSYGSKIPTGTPGAVLPNTATPGLFTGPHTPGYVLGTGMAVQFVKQCKPTIHRSRSELLRKKGDSGDTAVIFWADPSTYAMKRKTVAEGSTDWCNPDDKEGFVTCMRRRTDLAFVKTESVALEFPDNGKVRGICLGIMSVEGTAKEGDPIPSFVVMHDAMNFAYDEIAGFRNLVLVGNPDIIGHALGIQTRGRGIGISPGASASIFTELTASLVGGVAGSKGNTQYSFLPGSTFVVVALYDGPGTVLFDPLTASARPVSQQATGSDGNGKKLEASR